MTPLRAEARAGSSREPLIITPLVPEPDESDGVCASCNAWIPRCVCGAHHSQALIGRLKRKASAARLTLTLSLTLTLTLTLNPKP